jgi:hypothetical protein
MAFATRIVVLSGRESDATTIEFPPGIVAFAMTLSLSKEAAPGASLAYACSISTSSTTTLSNRSGAAAGGGAGSAASSPLHLSKRYVTFTCPPGDTLEFVNIWTRGDSKDARIVSAVAYHSEAAASVAVGPLPSPRSDVPRSVSSAPLYLPKGDTDFLLNNWKTVSGVFREFVRIHHTKRFLGVRDGHGLIFHDHRKPAYQPGVAVLPTS